MAVASHRPRPASEPRLPAHLDFPGAGRAPAAEDGRWSTARAERLVSPSAQLPALTLDEIRLSDCELSGARIDSLDVIDCELSGCDVANLETRRLAARRTLVAASRLTGVVGAGAELADVVFERCQMDLVTLREARLERVVFRDCVLREADLGAMRGDSVVFEDCDMTGVTLTGSRFARSELRSCRLDGLSGVEALRGVAMADDDVLSLARVFAAALGIRRLHDEAPH